MRIDRLWIKGFKNLKDFNVDFDVTSSRQVVVGRNGVGKSNLLEALARIFRELDLEEPPTFAYVIEYHCNGHYVKVKANEVAPANLRAETTLTRSYGIHKDNGQPRESQTEREYEPLKQAEFFKRNHPISGRVNSQRLLPQYVFGYYSGVSGRFNEVFAKHEEHYYREQITGEEAPLRPLFWAKPHHSQFALLSFFASSDELATKFLKQEFRIEGLASVLFSLHEPYWKRPRTKEKHPNHVDERFWQAGGKVAKFLDKLFQCSFAPMSGRQRQRLSIGQEKTLERRFCFIRGEEALRKLAAGLEPKEFFARMESTIFSDLISPTGYDVRVRVKIAGVRAPVTFRELSEGEQQLLTIIGLMRFTAQNESLFLLDEPDTFLNPAWSLDYLENLRTYGVEPPNSQIIMTTHSPLTFAGLNRNEVVVLQRERDGQITSQHPVTAPKGMGFQAILTSDFFGLRSTLDHETLSKLDEKRELALKDNKTDKDRKRLAELDEELGRLDFSKAARDPLYIEFIRAMTEAQGEHTGIKQPAPKMEDWQLRKKIAKDIAETLASLGEKT